MDKDVDIAVYYLPCAFLMSLSILQVCVIKKEFYGFWVIMFTFIELILSFIFVAYWVANPWINDWILHVGLPILAIATVGICYRVSVGVLKNADLFA
ncbi:MAG: hypothetical protein LBN22_00290 [Clostridiales Family XIII bacterium]|jgi:hypothetical protein|nr:hypothetical protein [Clostridiales Family XIII bacterium]